MTADGVNAILSKELKDAMANPKYAQI